MAYVNCRASVVARLLALNCPRAFLVDVPAAGNPSELVQEGLKVGHVWVFR